MISIDQLRTNLVQEAIRVQDDISVEIDNIIQSDIAGVRAQSSFVPDPATFVNSTPNRPVEMFSTCFVNNFTNTNTTSTGVAAVLDSICQNISQV